MRVASCVQWLRPDTPVTPPQDSQRAAARGRPGPRLSTPLREPGKEAPAGQRNPDTKPTLTTPALSIEAWDPAITSSWERLLPLPGGAPPAVPGHTFQGPFWGSRPFEGAP